MRAPTRRVVGAVVAVFGIILVVLGAWVSVKLGPSGEAQVSATSKVPGAIVVAPDVLNAVDVPVQITATRRDGGAVRVTVGPSPDARAILSTLAVSTVTSVRYPAGTLDLHASGAGVLTDVSTADVWRLAAKGAGSARLVVDQGRGAETAVVTSGDASALTGVTVRLMWANRAWFFEALGLATIGAVIAAFAFSDLWQSRAIAVQHDLDQTVTSGTSDAVT